MFGVQVHCSQFIVRAIGRMASEIVQCSTAGDCRRHSACAVQTHGKASRRAHDLAAGSGTSTDGDCNIRSTVVPREMVICAIKFAMRQAPSRRTSPRGTRATSRENLRGSFGTHAARRRKFRCDWRTHSNGAISRRRSIRRRRRFAAILPQAAPSYSDICAIAACVGLNNSNDNEARGL
jgi:hypothetical protein